MNKNVIYIIIAGCLWGIIALFINELNKIGFSSMQCVAIRVFLSAVILLTYLCIKKRAFLYIKLKDIKYFIGTGILSIVFFNFCYFECIKIIGGAAIPALLLYTAPIFVMIFSCIFFKEKMTVSKIISLIIAFLGLCFVTGCFGKSESISLVTILLGLGSGLGYALYSIFGKFLVNKYNILTITTYTFIVATLGVIPISNIWTVFYLFVDLKSILLSLGLAIFCTILPFLFYTKGLNKVEAGKAAILATIEPFMATIIGVLVYNENLSLFKILGLILIFLSIVYLNKAVR